MIDEGGQAPAQTVSGADGAVIDLGSPGRPVVLYFYPKDDTSGCTREAQDFTALAGEFEAANVAVVGVSRDSEASHAKFTAKYELGVPLHSDADGALSDAFGVWVQKSMYGRKYMGLERATFLIAPDGRVSRAWRKVKVPGHAAEVLETARKL